MAGKVKVSVKLNLEHELGPDHFQTWLCQLKIAFELHGVTDKKQQYLAAATNLGEDAAHYLWQQYSAVPSGDDPFQLLIELFEEYFGGKRSKTSRLAALFAVEQRDGESIQAYRHRIQKEMRACDLTNSSSVDDVLNAVAVHLFARGLQSPYTRQKVLEKGDNTLAKVAESAQAVTLATATVGEQQAGTDLASSATVSFASINRSASRPAQHRGCDYCGEQHPPGKRFCPAAKSTCAKCHKRGHYAKVCRSQRQQSPSPAAQAAARNYTVRAVSQSAEAGESAQVSGAASCGWMDQDSEVMEIFGVQTGKTGFVLPLRPILLDGQYPLEMRVDSGSMVTILPKSALPADIKLRASPSKLQPIGTSCVIPLGVFDGCLSHQGREVVETVYVVDDAERPTPALIGERASLGLDC